MSDIETFHLTTKDFTVLEVMLERVTGRDETMRVILQRKISNAIVTFREDIAPHVATLSSRVAYRVDDGPEEIRVIAHDDMRGLVGTILPITNLRGLALLGLSEGQSMEITRADGGRETLTLQQVLYQPEASQKQSERGGRADGQASGGEASAQILRPRGPFLRVVHSSDDLPPKPSHKTAVPASDNGFDDPGPSAA